MKSYDVITVGAGLAGLTCAQHLIQQGLDVLLIEASDEAGGRVRTDSIDGFLLDRGFQVFLTSYPTAQQVLDYAALDLKPFFPGSLICQNDSFYQIADPWKRPWDGLKTLFAPVGGIKDKFCIAKLTLQVSSLSLDQLLQTNETTTEEYLRQFGFSSEMINRFFKPFFGGVFLDPDLSTSSRMFLFVFQLFAKGKATLPANGMQAISKQLADSIPNDNIFCNTKVESLNQNSVRITEGQEFTSQAVVLATDWNSASTLVEEFKPTRSRSVSCLYFSAKEAPIQKPILVLNGNNTGPVNNLCVPSHVAPNYAPKDRHLISATVLQSDGQDENNLVEEVRQQMVEWFGSVAADYEHIKTYSIPHALPDQSPPFSVHHDSRLSNGVFVCGDYRNTASINGAMQSGLNAADSVLKHLYQKEPSALT